MSKIELFGEELDLVNGGDITYTWDGEKGTIGMNGYNPFLLLDKEKFVEYYKSVRGTMKDSAILTNLFEMGVIAQKG